MKEEALSPMLARMDRALFPQSLLRFLAACERLGTPPHEALSLFCASFRLPAPTRDDVTELASRLRAGSTLAEQAGAFPDIFPPWLARLLRWAQKSGELGPTLDLAARELDREARTGRTLYTMFAYPAALVTCAMLLALFSTLFIAPQYRSILRAMGLDRAGLGPTDQAAPLVSAASEAFLRLTDCSDVLAAGFVLWIAVLTVLVWSRMPWHREANAVLRRVLPGVPAIEARARESLVAHLVAGGLAVEMPLPDILAEVAPLAGTADLETLLCGAAQSIRQGTAPAEAIEAAAPARAAAFATALASAVSGPDPVGTLERIAAVSAGDATDRLARLPRVYGPLVSVATALLVGALPVAQMLTLVRITSFVCSF